VDLVFDDNRWANTLCNVLNVSPSTPRTEFCTMMMMVDVVQSAECSEECINPAGIISNTGAGIHTKYKPRRKSRVCGTNGTPEYDS
jgi:hypothetical protein